MIRAAITHGIQLTVLVLILCVLGIIAALKIPTQMIPDLEVRTISVQTRWPGATPQDVEQEILIRQEDYLRTLSGLSRMVSSARTGEAVIELEFPFGADLNDALIRVNNALSQVPAYPENVDEPRLLTASFSQNSFMYYRVEPLPGRAVELNMVRMRDYVEDYVRTRMERVPGVSHVSVGGGAERQIRIRIDPHRLAATGLTLTELRDAIRERNTNISAGDIDSGKRRYLLRTVGRFEDLEQLKDLIVSSRGDSIIRLKDLAEVELEHFEIRSISYGAGKQVINMSVRRETGSNVIEIKKAMEIAVDEINRDLLAPIGLRVAATSDDVRYVVASITNVWTNLTIGALLATLVMFLFLRSSSATMVGVSGIPLCTIAAFIGLLLSGRTINVISLAGVAFAIGMTLDNSIVVLEAIERRRRLGMDKMTASLQGAGNVWRAILASTLTTILVFTPILFIEEEAGQLFSDIAIAISASIITSMLVAITVIPSASARITMSSTHADTPQERDRLTRWAALFKARTTLMIAALIEKPSRAGAVVGATFILAITIILFLTPPAEYLPEGEEAKIFSALIPPAGFNLTEMKTIGESVNKFLVPHIKADPSAFLAGKTDIPPLAFLVGFVSAERIYLVAETVNPHHIEPLREAIRQHFKQYPGMHSFSARGSIISSNDGGTRSVNLDIGGNDLRSIYQVATAAYQRAGEIFENPEIRSTPSSLSLAQPLIELRPDWDRAAELGFTAQELGYSIAALTDGAYVDEYLLEGDRVDIFLYSAAGTTQKLSALADLPLFAPQQGIVPLSAVVDIVEGVDTDTIRRLDGRRTVTLNIIPPSDIPLEVAVARVKQEVVDHLRQSGQVPDAVTLNISGASDQLDRTRQALIGNFLVALLLCYFLLVAIFSHWGFPLVIMATVPLGIAGGIVGLWILNFAGGLLPWFGLSVIRQPFDMITMLGFLILLGTVVNNPILIVDRTLKGIRDEGVGPREAIKTAVDARFRPMMMSTITTVFGIAPLVLIPGAGTELYRGIGAIVLFGLLFSTLVTLVFMPSLLMLVFSLTGKVNSSAKGAG
jgi:multidrug efflux pump subunit AcrB